MALSFRRLKQLLDYDPTTGVFTWRVDGRGRFQRKGARAGTINGQGRRQICIDCVIYQCARLAVFWMTGHMPRRLIDHRNRIRNDDRWSNLRSATYSQNGANNDARGVSWDRERGKYKARIKVNYRTINLGRFDTEEEARDAYLVAKRRHFGQFA